MIVKQKYYGILNNPNKTQPPSNQSFCRLQSLHQNTNQNRDQPDKYQFKIRSRVKTQYIHSNKKVKALPILNTLDFEPLAKDLFDAEIYHRPSLRKKYFCQLIDTYMKKETNSEEKGIDRDNTKFLKLHSNLNMTHFQLGKNGGSAQKQGSIIKQSQKRATTAGQGYSRLIQTHYNDNKKYSNQIRKRTLEYERAGKNYLKIQNKVKVMKTLQARAESNLAGTEKKNNQSERELARNRKKEKVKDNEQNSASQNLSLSDSDIERDFVEESSNLFSTLKTENNRDNNSKNKTRNSNSTKIKRGLSSNFFQSRLFEKSKKKLDFIKVEQEKDQWTNLEKIEAQIISRIPNIDKQTKPWTIVSVHKHQLYHVYELQVKKPMSGNREKSKTTLSLNGKQLQKNRMKVKRFNQETIGSKLRNTIEKIKESGVSQLWKQLPHSSQKNKEKREAQMKLFFCQNAKNLRQQLFQFIKEEKSNNESGVSYLIQTTNYYKQLFESNCQGFIDIIASIASDLSLMSGKIINNKLNIDNIYWIQQKNIKIGDWGCAALCRRLQIANKQVFFKDEPTLKFEQSSQGQLQSKQRWLSSPQSLPPEIITCLIEGNYSRIWQIQQCPEVWSLGLIIFEILSCVPVWMPYPSTINHKISKKGCLFDKGKRLGQILQFQKRIPMLVTKWIRQNKQQKIVKQIDPQIINIMKSSLQINPKNRPKPQEIIKRLRGGG